MEIHAAALGVEAPGHRDGLQQRRFTRPVLPHQEGYRLLERQIAQSGDGGDGVGVDVAGRDAVLGNPDPGRFAPGKLYTSTG